MCDLRFQKRGAGMLARLRPFSASIEDECLNGVRAVTLMVERVARSPMQAVKRRLRPIKLSSGIAGDGSGSGSGSGGGTAGI
jgi:hypothetical protein